MSNVTQHDRVVGHLRDALAQLGEHIETTSARVSTYLATPNGEPSEEDTQP